MRSISAVSDCTRVSRGSQHIIIIPCERCYEHSVWQFVIKIPANVWVGAGGGGVWFQDIHPCGPLHSRPIICVCRPAAAFCAAPLSFAYRLIPPMFSLRTSKTIIFLHHTSTRLIRCFDCITLYEVIRPINVFTSLIMCWYIQSRCFQQGGDVL